MRAASAAVFHNFLGYDRRWLDAKAAAIARARRLRAGRRARQQSAGRLSRAGPRVDRGGSAGARRLRSLRAQAYVILAWDIFAVRR